MQPDEVKRIGIFEYDWSLYSFIKDLVIGLAEAGYQVDIFQKNQDTRLSFTNTDEFKKYGNVRYFTFTTSNKLPQRILRKSKDILGRLNRGYQQNPGNIIDGGILRESRKILDGSKYSCFIGIEKGGIIWAGMLSQLYKCPLAYYSLELYIEDHPAIRQYSSLRPAERKYHQLSGATIIQDKLRAQALLKYNEVDSTNLLYFPISVRGEVVEKKSDFFQQKFKIEGDKKLILYFGMIQEERFSTALVKIGDHFQSENILVLHGFGEQAYLAYLQSIADKDRVLFSLDFVAEDQILDVISAATIGLALYDNSTSNDRLAAFSSVKVAYYLQCGVPIIAFDSESFRELMKSFRCGELINSIDEIPQKVEIILKDYDSYKNQALMAFKKYYNFDENFKKFHRDFDDFISNKGLTKASSMNSSANQERIPNEDGI